MKLKWIKFGKEGQWLDYEGVNSSGSTVAKLHLFWTDRWNRKVTAEVRPGLMWIKVRSPFATVNEAKAACQKALEEMK